MATIITAPELYIPAKSHVHKIFLAGAIDMGAAVDWQAYVIEQLKDIPDLVVMNPRRAEFTADTLDEQILWELNALEAVDQIFMWFPKAAKAPISFFEAGLYWRSGKLLVGAEQDFYRRRNLELTALFHATALYDDLDMMIKRIVIQAASNTQILA